MKNSLEIATEKFFISMLRVDSRLKGKDFFHFDEEQRAKSNAIVVQAKQGNHSLAAFGGYEIEVTVEYRAPAGTTKARNDLVTSALHSAVYQSKLSPAEMQAIRRNSGLANLLIKDESTSDRENTENLRKRTLVLPVQAQIA